MAITKTINFLPSYLQTTVNERFLNSTLDRLVGEGTTERFDGHIGHLILLDHRKEGVGICSPFFVT